MAITEYDYPISDTEYDTCDPGKLDIEIVAALPTKTVDHIDVDSTNVRIFMGQSLSLEDEIILYSVFIAHDGRLISQKDRNTIMTEILYAAEPTAQLPRLLAALDSYPSFAIFLDNFNYPYARMRMQYAMSLGAITQDDYDLIDSVVPE